MDFFIRKNEAIFGGVVGFTFLFMHLDEVGGLIELVLVVGGAFGLELLEEGKSFFELAGESLAVEAEVREGAGLGVQGGGDREGVLDLFRCIAEGRGGRDDAEGEEIVFERGDAVETPGGVGQGLCEMGS